jgi:hypothetical protein
MATELKAAPFQVQIHYTRKDGMQVIYTGCTETAVIAGQCQCILVAFSQMGMRGMCIQCMRVITATRRVTTKRDKTEAKADVAVLALASVQRAAREAQVGRFMEARMNLFASERLMKRAAHTDTQMEEHVHTPHAACRVTCVVVCCVVMCVVRSVIDDVYFGVNRPTSWG